MGLLIEGAMQQAPQSSRQARDSETATVSGLIPFLTSAAIPRGPGLPRVR